MYKVFFGFQELPFNMTPNSRFFYESVKHTEALSTMVYAIEQRKGFVVITGDIGSGKTTVCRALLNQLDAKTETALITNTFLSSKDLLCTILEDLDVDYTPGSKAKLLSQLNHYLIEQIRSDRNVVLIIDEAQNLSTSVLEEIRMLSNLETESEKLLQIIFLGQPELRQKLSLPRLEQLRQRIAVYFHLNPLDARDTSAYIQHRLHVASNGDREYFTPESVTLAFQFAKGIPRLINQICDSALLSAYIYGRDIVDADLMHEVIAESPAAQILGQMPLQPAPAAEDESLVITENMTSFPSEGHAGISPPEMAAQPFDRDAGPAREYQDDAGLSAEDEKPADDLTATTEEGVPASAAPGAEMETDNDVAEDAEPAVPITPEAFAKDEEDVALPREDHSWLQTKTEQQQKPDHAQDTEEEPENRDRDSAEISGDDKDAISDKEKGDLEGEQSGEPVSVSSKDDYPNF